MKKIIATLTTLAALLIAGWCSLPYVAAYHIRKAVQTHDAELLSSHIHFSALREHLRRADLSAFLLDSVHEDPAPTRWTATLGRAAARAVTAKMVDRWVNPDGVAALLKSKESLPTKMLHALSQKGADLRYEYWDVFSITTRQGRWGHFYLTLRRTGIYWQIHEIVFIKKTNAPLTISAK